MDDLVQYLQDREGDMVELLRELVLMESPSNDTKLTNAMGDYLYKIVNSMIEADVTRLSGEPYAPHIKAEWGEGDGQLLIVTHLDTVWPEGTLEDMPCHIETGKLYGPGSFDMKAGIVQALFAIQAIEQVIQTMDKKVILLMTSDEELGSPTSKPYIEEEATKSDAVFVLEPAQGERGALKTARKGVGTYELKVHGISSHAGIEPEKGVSAIEELAEQITYLSNLTDIDQGTTVNVGVIDGGSSKNMIAEEAHAVVDVRVQSEAEMNRVVSEIETIKPINDGISIDIQGSIYRPPLERTNDSEVLFEHAQALAKQYLNIELEEESTGGGSDANFTASLEPTLDGLGAVGDGAHAKHEHVIIHELPKRSALLAMLLRRYGQVSQ
ncbi:M20 family metallopeptidase [Alkalibacillus almallahensis]|uniref:M20 family metallopeptidase n=1 Tax=Alkalibacillus almallahensis TaxID=1379154 RepID=UPI00142171B5|nr:M20 family metallopeptidase [Alkalibacillus almallahensis]NIK12026.1 glutamate carboxypeptidase [Alkalibacillus almallahensis]